MAGKVPQGTKLVTRLQKVKSWNSSDELKKVNITQGFLGKRPIFSRKELKVPEPFQACESHVSALDLCRPSGSASPPKIIWMFSLEALQAAQFFTRRPRCSRRTGNELITGRLKKRFSNISL